MVDGLLANVGIGIVPLIRSSYLAKEVPVQSLVEKILSLSLCRTKVNSLMMILGRVKCRKLIPKNIFHVIQTYSMCQVTSVCRGSAWNENLES